MDGIIYTAMNAAKQIMLRQASNNHNLANMNTTGFRADLDTFEAQPMFGPGQPTRVYLQNNRAGIDFSSGHLMTTGSSLDVAINGSGFIAIQDNDGEESLTRRGDLHLSASGILQNGAGYPVMGNGGPISIPPSQKIEIGKDGTVSIQPLGQSSTTLAVIDRIKLVNPPTETLKKNESGLLRTIDGEELVADANIKLESGTLETSNVNSMDALVNMIELARQFEMSINILKDQKEIDQAASAILRLA